jgi:hypothetical protein
MTRWEGTVKRPSFGSMLTVEDGVEFCVDNVLVLYLTVIKTSIIIGNTSWETVITKTKNAPMTINNNSANLGTRVFTPS